jgi:hypothetical protein
MRERCWLSASVTTDLRHGLLGSRWPRALQKSGARALGEGSSFPVDHDGVFLKGLTERSLLETRTVDRERLATICDVLGIPPRSGTDINEDRRAVGTR